jgi:hypothetical protein
MYFDELPNRKVVASDPTTYTLLNLVFPISCGIRLDRYVCIYYGYDGKDLREKNETPSISKTKFEYSKEQVDHSKVQRSKMKYKCSRVKCRRGKGEVFLFPR